MSEKLQYKVKPGKRFGSFFEYSPGSIVELTEEQAAGFPDILEPFDQPVEINPVSEKEYLLNLTIKQLNNFNEYSKIPDPKPTNKADIVDAILKVRSGAGAVEVDPDPDPHDFNESFNNDLVLESMTLAELKALPEWEFVEPKPTKKAEVLAAIRNVRGAS